MKKITRTILTHSIQLGAVRGTSIEPFGDVVEMDELPTSKMLAKKSKEAGVQIVIMSDTPIEHKYEMEQSKFVELADLVDVND